MAFKHDDYTVACICALPLEMAAAKMMLDEIHPTLPQPETDHNAYTLGNIGSYNVVVACLPSGIYGTTSAAIVLAQMLPTFPFLRFALMVGIGGGVPNRNTDIRLGDVVVSMPTATSGGVIQYDHGKTLCDGRLHRTGSLNKPPQYLLTAISQMRSDTMAESSRTSRIKKDIAEMLHQHQQNHEQFRRPATDWLFRSSYDHKSNVPDCSLCDDSELVARTPRETVEPKIHYGLIASGNQVMKNARTRDFVAKEIGILCFEMEAAGLMDQLPCLVIRGICDYCDSHKQKGWQGYAALAAAVYAKKLLSVVPILAIQDARTKSFRVPLDLTEVPAIELEQFIGREDELSRIWEYLQPAILSRKVAILHGLGGIGKTQLAIRFARDHKSDFTAIFWLNGKDRSAVVQALSSCLPRILGQFKNAEVTTKEDAEQRASQFLQWLSIPENTCWLLIFDNIDQYCAPQDKTAMGYDISQFFPKSDHGSILITSRLERLTELGKSFPIQRLSTGNATQLLLRSAGYSNGQNISPETSQDAVNLSNRLDGLPLAVVIAGAYMRETGTGIGKYLELYQDFWFELQSQSKPMRQYQHGNILQTWLVSYQEVQRRDPTAAALLLLLACFDNRDIWYELVKSSRGYTASPAWYEMAVKNEIAFKARMGTLLGFSLLESKQQEESYALHPVVQDWCLHVAGTRDTASLFNEIALVSVGNMVPRESNRDFANIQQRLLPHADHLVSRKIHYFPAKTNGLSGAFHNIGDLYCDRGKFKQAEAMYQQALAGKEDALGHDHVSTLDTVNNLGLLYSSQAKLKEAEKMYQRALTGYEKALGPDDTSTLQTVNNLGNLYRDQGKLKEAKEMYHRALSGKEKTLGRDHISTLDTVNNLGLLYSSQGKLNKAEEMYQRALTGYEKALGSGHTSTLHTVNNLGLLYSNKGKLKEAEEMYQRALAGYEKALGSDHASTLHTVNNIGLLYDSQGKLKEAEEMYKRALSGKEKALGRDHTSTLDIVNNLGLLYSHQGKLKKAEEMYQRALTGYEKALGSGHTSTLRTVNNFGLLYHDQSKLKEAEMMFQRALAGFEKALGSDHISTLHTVNNLGLLYSNQGKLKEAEQMYQQAVAGYEKALGPNHTSTLRTINNLGLLYSHQGKLEEAEEMYQRALAGYEKALGSDHTSALRIVDSLGFLYSRQGNLKEAEKMYQRALAGYEQALGVSHPKTREVAKSLLSLTGFRLRKRNRSQ
ncbi:hypothetical protein BJX63DRAFT_426718 [Aspergillus granulosus]|uniref:Nucleoside phosphorylase domain-containing protein n=1 Tax=Aspergillus granulosus TaxID=176169 RepID=A0ABR4I5G6_9EURO